MKHELSKNTIHTTDELAEVIQKFSPIVGLVILSAGAIYIVVNRNHVQSEADSAMAQDYDYKNTTTIKLGKWQIDNTISFTKH